MMPPTTITIGQRLTDFAGEDMTVERIASGGFGIVYFGPNRVWNGNWVALKTMRPDVLGASPRVRELFIREGLTWTGLWPHAQLLTAHAVTEINAQPFIVLDYAELGSLRDLLARPLPLELRLGWTQCIVAGLAAIHTPDPELLRPEPLVHRDLKPDNVLIMGNGMAVITDFGLAKAVESDPAALVALAAIQETANPTAGASEPPSAAATHSRRYQTRRGTALGTLAYMAPEQWEDAASAGSPADCYAFGLILSELLAGRHALLDLDVRHSEAAWREAHAQGQPRPLRERAPELPPTVDDLYQALLAKRPEARPTAGQALAVLQGAAAALGQAPYQVHDRYPRTPRNLLVWWHNWANAYARFGYYEEALARNDRAYALDPQNSAVLLARGNMLGNLQRTEEALAAYAAAERALPPEEVEGRCSVWNMRGVKLSEAGRYGEAEVAFAQAVTLQPENAIAWFNRANNERLWGEAQRHAAEARGHYQRGLAHVARAIALNPNNPRYHQLQAALQQALAQASD